MGGVCRSNFVRRMKPRLCSGCAANANENNRYHLITVDLSNGRNPAARLPDSRGALRQSRLGPPRLSPFLPVGFPCLLIVCRWNEARLCSIWLAICCLLHNQWLLVLVSAHLQWEFVYFNCATFCSTSIPIRRARLPPRIFFFACVVS